MKIDFVDRSNQLSPSVQDAAERSMRYALSRFTGAIEQVTIVTNDENGPKGGVDKRCLAKVKLRSRGSVELTHSATDFAEGLSHLARRLSRSVARELDARKEHTRQSIRTMSM